MLFGHAVGIHGSGVLPFAQMNPQLFHLLALREVVEVSHPLYPACHGAPLIVPEGAPPKLYAVTPFTPLQGPRARG